MKNRWIAFIIFVFLACMSTNLFAQESYYAKKRSRWKHSSPQKVLEVSLTSLKESAYEVREKNEWLFSENASLQSTVDNLHEQIKSLNQQKEKFLAVTKKSKSKVNDGLSEMKVLEQRALRVNRNLNQLEQEQKSLQDQINAKKVLHQRLKKQIILTQKENLNLRNKMQMVEQQRQKDIDPQMEEMRILLKESQESLKDAEVRFRKLKKKYAKPLLAIEDLQEAQIILRQRVSMLQDELKVGSEQQSKLQGSIDIVEQQNNNQLAELEERIQELKNRNQELKDVLAKARAKISDKNLRFSSNTSEVKQLQSNLDVVQKENLLLKEEFTTLKETLAKLDGK